MSYGAWSNSSSSQHSRTATCRTCGYSTTEYSSHSYSTGAWSKYSDTQHRRSKTCSGCGASIYDAVVSAVSKAVTEQEVLSIVFVLEWGGE